MKIVSDLRYAFARSVPGAIADGSEGEIGVYEDLLPTIELVGPIGNVAAFVATVSARESFSSNAERGQDASQAAAFNTICTFGRGLWRVHLHLATLASFTQASGAAAAPHVLILLIDPPGTGGRLMAAHAVNAQPINQEKTFVALFPVDGWALRLNHDATGVGQTIHSAATVLAWRLH